MEQDFSEVGDDDAVEQVLDPDWLDAELDRDRLELDPVSLPDLPREKLKNYICYIKIKVKKIPLSLFISFHD